MKKIVVKALKTKRFLYGAIVAGMSIVALLLMMSGESEIYSEVDRITRDERYSPEMWKAHSRDEQSRLMEQKMAILNRKSQIEMGKPFFMGTAVLGFLLIGTALIPFRSKADRILDEMDEEE